MNYRLNVGRKYPLAKTQEEWDMIDRAAIIDECRVIARKTIRTCEMQAAIMRDKIRTGAWDGAQRVADAFDHNGEKFAEIAERLEALAAVPPAPSAAPSETPVERLRAVLEMQASPTIDRGDSHGARGQKGWIVWESSLPFVAAVLAAVPPAPSTEDAPLTDAERMIIDLTHERDAANERADEAERRAAQLEVDLYGPGNEDGDPNDIEAVPSAPPSFDAAMAEKYKALVQFYDEHVGTPCEQIRHAQEIGRALEALKEARSCIGDGACQTQGRDGVYAKLESAIAALEGK